MRLHAEKWGVQFWVQPRDWSNTRDLKEFVIDFLFFSRFLRKLEGPGKSRKTRFVKASNPGFGLGSVATCNFELNTPLSSSGN